MMHRFDLDVDVFSDEELAQLAKKKAKLKKKKAKAKKAAAGKKAKSGKKKTKKVAAGKKSKGKGKGKGKKHRNETREAASAPEITEMKLDPADVAAAFSPVRGERSFSQSEALLLGFVDLGEDHPRAEPGKAYPVVSASSLLVGRVDIPQNSPCRMHLDLLEFYAGGFPGFLSETNDGLVEIQASTKNPHDLSASMTDASTVTDFKAKDRSYSPGFSSQGVFRNVLLQDWVTLTVRLYELDPDASEYHATIKGFMDVVPEIQSLDVLKGVPYLRLAAQLFEGLINGFSRNPDDHLWGELPILSVNPRPGGAFLRTGIYLLSEKLNGKKKAVELDQLEYRDGKVRRKNGKRLPNHLLFGVDLAEHEEG